MLPFPSSILKVLDSDLAVCVFGQGLEARLNREGLSACISWETVEDLVVPSLMMMMQRMKMSLNFLVAIFLQSPLDSLPWTCLTSQKSSQIIHGFQKNLLAILVGYKIRKNIIISSKSSSQPQGFSMDLFQINLFLENLCILISLNACFIPDIFTEDGVHYNIQTLGTKTFKGKKQKQNCVF